MMFSNSIVRDDGMHNCCNNDKMVVCIHIGSVVVW